MKFYSFNHDINDAMVDRNIVISLEMSGHVGTVCGLGNQEVIHVI